MTVREAAKRLEVSQATVYALVASGRLRCNRIGLSKSAVVFSQNGLQPEVIREHAGLPQRLL
jgi:excisionase family DNA binding protein